VWLVVFHLLLAWSRGRGLGVVVGSVLASASAKPKALAPGRDDGGAVGEAIDERGGELLVSGEDLGPLAEGEIGRDDDGAALVARREEIEEELASGAIEGDEAELVDDEELEASETALEARELALVAGFEQGADEVGRTPEGDVATLAHRLDAKRDGEVGFARADRTG